ncbi:hypothetical protein [Actinoplanes sp. NPDC051851]|uniref:hypothetical protein n=1 Tax=Actinoplanes sp. NPDC051851 TaxID=3154753 RepID=UPI00341A2B13
MAVKALQLPGVPLCQSPRAVPRVLTTEFLRLGRIVATLRAVSHDGHLSRGEKLKLSHAEILLRLASDLPAVDLP